MFRLSLLMIIFLASCEVNENEKKALLEDVSGMATDFSEIGIRKMEGRMGYRFKP